MALDGKSYSALTLGNGTTLKFEHKESLFSTADIAKEYAACGYPDRYAVFTEHQTDGRLIGTKTREGKLEKGVFLSIILRPSLFPSQFGAITPISIVALTQAIEEFTHKALGISWPSDLFCDGKRIGSVQIEKKLGSPTSYEYVIINFGVKVSEKNFPPRLCDMVKKVFEKDNPSVGMMMAKSILENFFNAYGHIEAPEKSIDYYRKKFILSGLKAKCIVEGRHHLCKIVGINPEKYSLTVKLSKTRFAEVISSSDISIPKKIKQKSKAKEQKAK